jgi:hypothetical protein
MPRGVIKEELHEQLIALHTEGYGRNAIAREMGIAPACVSRTAEFLGLSFDRARIQAATTARLADLAERRSILAVKFQDVAEDSLAKVDEPCVVYAFGGKDNVYEEHTFDDGAPPAERRALVSAAGVAADKSLKLAPAEQNSGVDAAKSMLGSIGEALAHFVQAEDELQAESGGE